MNIVLWGVRGSIASPTPDTAFYGGNTACLEVRTDSVLLFMDAGTGLREAGKGIPYSGWAPGCAMNPTKHAYAAISPPVLDDRESHAAWRIMSTIWRFYDKDY